MILGRLVWHKFNYELIPYSSHYSCLFIILHNSITKRKFKITVILLLEEHIHTKCKNCIFMHRLKGHLTSDSVVWLIIYRMVLDVLGRCFLLGRGKNLITI